MVFNSSSRHICGSLAYLNTYNIIQKTSYVCLDEELTYLRHWIASAIDISEETVKMEKNKKKFIPQKTDVTKKKNLKFVEMFLVMLVWKDLNPFLIKLTIMKNPLMTHLYLLKVSQVTEKRKFLIELGLKIQILKTIWI